MRRGGGATHAIPAAGARPTEDSPGAGGAPGTHAFPLRALVKPALKLCLMGASTDTGNLGVSALCLSILHGIAQREPDADVTVFDNRRGVGRESERLGGRTFSFRRSGLHDS